MKILLSRISPVGEVIHEYPSLRTASKELECSERHLSDMLKQRRTFIETPYGQITKVTTHDGKTYGTPSAVPEHTAHAQENSTVGVVAFGGGWGGIKQALEQAASAIQRALSKLYKS
jgi:hypothetical protein